MYKEIRKSGSGTKNLPREPMYKERVMHNRGCERKNK